MENAITRDDWLKAYTDAQTVPVNEPDVLSAAELAALFGVTPKGAQLRIKRMLEAGTIQQTHKYIKTATGSARQVLAYRVVKG